MYFDNFPKILYDFDINGKTEFKLVRDISQNVRVRKEVLANVTLYDEYDIRDGETPEIIAEKVYGSPMYQWVVMLCNEKYNYVDDFPLPAYELEKHIYNKYGSIEEVNAPHHFVDPNGNIVDEFAIDVYENAVITTPVSNHDYEVSLNESKRRIKLISPSLLNTILKNFKDLI
jgi:hypothetical protein